MRTVSKITKAKRLLNRVNSLDAKYLLGQVPNKEYRNKRAKLRKEFESFKKQTK